ncbi:MAG: hypothetical protein MI921_21435 [Cytophagales bacterium]|nr:hypothetical protein [Cytophagales bacterium]
MVFKTFENKTDYLEYLQIFLYHELEVQGKSAVSLDDYVHFELTDKLINLFNSFIESGQIEESKVFLWLKENTEKHNYFKDNFPSKYKPKVSIWSDRKKTGYYKRKLQDSFLFENFIADLIQEKYGLDLGQYLTPEGQYELGENALGIEIKNDTLIKKYGNVYIEYQEKSKGSNYGYVNSGILKVDNCEYFLIGTEEQFFIFRKNRLIEILKDEITNLRKGVPSTRHIVFKQIATSKGYVYPVKYAINDTISMDAMIRELKDKL